jgi:hypothetical protein
MICGAPGFNSGDGHLCPEHGGKPPVAAARPGPPLMWQALTWIFVAVTVTYAVLLVADIGALAAADSIVERFVADPVSITTAASRGVLDLADLLNSVTLVWIWLYLAGFIAWTVTSRRSVDRLGHDRQEILAHWTYTTWRLSIVVVIALSLFVANRALPGTDDPVAFRDAFVSHSHALMGYTVVRIGMLALLTAYVVIVWRRLTGYGVRPV